MSAALTAAQRARKVAAANRRLVEAASLLGAVAEDLRDKQFKSRAEMAEWREVLDVLLPIERSLDAQGVAR